MISVLGFLFFLGIGLAVVAGLSEVIGAAVLVAVALADKRRRRAEWPRARVRS